ncbi:hypothetical protein MED217_18576 [Leeuwenhoekiella blandensis MED217]|uniref:Uncharacterized protein n=1 Tax=Leeuwenhoekiella blandensis (strain CECT 7118 / CCUG 51940 / KCTC 22103 / MED217) TaxID=398720 RepID=A3XRE6_LEEBM|nr:hypothetical protein MED217_18576 [Leeuwenhoekiella blandensis MED217]
MLSNFMEDKNQLLGISGAFFLKFDRKTEAPHQIDFNIRSNEK